MRTRYKVVLGCGILGIAGSVLTLIVMGVAGTFVFGWNYSDTPRDRARLQAICDPVKDVPLVIEAHYAKHGGYPATIEELDRSLAGAEEAVVALNSAGFIYSSAGGPDFSIYKKLNWDGGIHYDSNESRWEFGIHDDIEWPIH